MTDTKSLGDDGDQVDVHVRNRVVHCEGKEDAAAALRDVSRWSKQPYSDAATAQLRMRIQEMLASEHVDGSRDLDRDVQLFLGDSEKHAAAMEHLLKTYIVGRNTASPEAAPTHTKDLNHPLSTPELLKTAQLGMQQAALGKPGQEEEGAESADADRDAPALPPPIAIAIEEPRSPAHALETIGDWFFDKQAYDRYLKPHIADIYHNYYEALNRRDKRGARKAIIWGHLRALEPLLAAAWRTVVALLKIVSS